MGVKTKVMELLHESPLEISINMKLRYHHVLKELQRLKKDNPELSVLEIGSGSKGITRFFKHPVTGMDVAFQDHKNEYLKEVTASATEKFPFKDGEFDVVISIDAVEHIPKEKRVFALKEMKRVAKTRILLAYPCGYNKWDDRIIKKWPKNSPTYKNIKEHVDAGIPDGSEIKEAFGDCHIKSIQGTSSGLSYSIKVLEKNLVGKMFSRTLMKAGMPFFVRTRGDTRKCFFIRKGDKR